MRTVKPTTLLIEKGDALAEFIRSLPFDLQPNGLVNGWEAAKEVVSESTLTDRHQSEGNER